MAKKVKAKAGVGIRILGDRLLVDIMRPDQKTDGGVFLPSSVQSGSFKKGIVRVLGEGTKLDDGTMVAPIVNVGDVVLLPSQMGVAMELEGQKLLLVKETDIIGILK